MDNREDVWPPPISSQPQPKLPRPLDSKTTLLALISFCLASVGSLIIIGIVIHKHLLQMNQPINLPNGQVMFIIDSRDMYGVVVNVIAIALAVAGRRSPWAVRAIVVSLGTIGLDFMTFLLHW